MGDEQIKNNTQEETVEAQTDENEKTKEEHHGEETNLVKILRKKLEEEIKSKKMLEEKIKRAEETGFIANVDEVLEKLRKIDKLEFENQVVKKYPFLADKVDEVWQLKKDNEDIEDAVAKYLGKQNIEQLTKTSSGTVRIAPNIQEISDLNKLSPEDREKEAKRLFNKVYGIEE